MRYIIKTSYNTNSHRYPLHSILLRESELFNQANAALITEVPITKRKQELRMHLIKLITIVINIPGTFIAECNRKDGLLPSIKGTYDSIINVTLGKE